MDDLIGVERRKSLAYDIIRTDIVSKPSTRQGGVRMGTFDSPTVDP